MGYIDLNQIEGGQPRRLYRAGSTCLGCAPEGMGAFSLDRVARDLGTDTKTLLLIGGAGIVAGYLLNDAAKATGRAVSRTRRRATRAIKRAATPRALIIGGVTIAVLGAGYLYWQHNKHTIPALPEATTAPPALPKHTAARGAAARGYAPTQRVTVP
jgi:hypothetical protein